MYSGYVIKYTIIGKINTTHYLVLFKYNEYNRNYLAFLISSKQSKHSILITKKDLPILDHDSYIQLDNIHTIKYNNIKKDKALYKLNDDLYDKINQLWNKIKLKL